jgi:hypothetical protein
MEESGAMGPSDELQKSAEALARLEADLKETLRKPQATELIAKLQRGDFVNSTPFAELVNNVLPVLADQLAIIADVITFARFKAKAKGAAELTGALLNKDYIASTAFQELLANFRAFHEDNLAKLADAITFARYVVQQVPKPRTAADIEEWKNKWQTAAVLIRAASSTDTLLLDGKWLIEMAAARKALPKRQLLPDGAGADTQALEASLSKANLQCPFKLEAEHSYIVAISYCWATAQHPDPSSEQLQRLRTPLQLMLETGRNDKGQIKGLAVFLDWCSLHQAERTEAEQEVFKRGLKAVNIWCAR